MASHIENITTALHKVPVYGGLFANLPNMNLISETIEKITTPILPALEEFSSLGDSLYRVNTHINNYIAAVLERDASILDSEGYLFRDSWSSEDLYQLLGIHLVDSRVRRAVLTNKLLAITRSNDFALDLKNKFQDSLILIHRWNIIENALEAHANRGYLLSIPALLAQLEGILADTLVMKGLVYIKNGKVFAKGNEGRRPIELKGMYHLADKVKKSELQNDQDLQLFANLLTYSLSGERNRILHGRNVDYGKAKLSVSLLIYISGLAAEISKHADIKEFAMNTNSEIKQ